MFGLDFAVDGVLDQFCGGYEEKSVNKILL